MTGIEPRDRLDCLVIGGGPAGLTAAIYLARFHLAVRIVEDGRSRAALIPRTRNHAGYPGGISGEALLALMREQAAEFGVEIDRGRIETLVPTADGFTAAGGDKRWHARTVLLATGVINNRPPMAAEDHDRALAQGLLRYCPICDGYEVTDRRVGVIGTDTRGFNEAVFLRMYTPDVTLIAPGGPHVLSDAERRELDALDVRIADGPCRELRPAGAQLVVPTPRGDLAFDSVYPALGSVIRSDLAVSLGAEATEEGCLVVDRHQRTSIGGLYAAGDVTRGLDQISHAMGEAGVAATAVRNDLAAASTLARR